MKPPIINDDFSLIERLRNEETVRDAFSEVIDKYSHSLYAQIRRIVQSHDDTNDILQNTFLKAWTSLDSFRGEAKLSTWLYKIAINESITFLSKEQKRRRLTDAEMTDEIISTIESDTNIDGEKLIVEFRKSIAQLPEKQRLVFNMRYFDEMRYDQISDILGTSVGALKASYHLAVKKIEQYFRNLS